MNITVSLSNEYYKRLLFRLQKKPSNNYKMIMYFWRRICFRSIIGELNLILVQRLRSGCSVQLKNFSQLEL